MEELKKDLAEIKKNLASLTSFTREKNTLQVSVLNMMNNRISGVEKELLKLNKEVHRLNGNTKSNFKIVDGKLNDIKSEIKKIGDVTGYDGIMSNLKIVKK